MIEVIYYREHNRLTAKGHARSDVYGKDLVCAAVSALALTLGANISHMADCGYVNEPIVKLEEGNAEISCKPRARYSQSVRQVMMAVCVGFEILAGQYPDYVRYAVRG